LTATPTPPSIAPVVVVTGGLGTLGAAVVDAFLSAGYRVAVIDRMPPDSPAAVALRGRSKVLALTGVDLADSASCAVAMQSAAQQFGRIDVLVNIAGGFRWEPVQQGAIETWDFLYTTNVRTTAIACHAALPFLKQQDRGRIINIGAGAAASRAAQGMGAYTASKAGVHKLTESLADEVKDLGITVNAILPGTIDTPQNRADMPQADRTRWVAPRDIAEVILFLASERAQAVTGALIPVNGRA
jgi:NAD(P)-dependent dehydrogenase (short-subunit alcohol dehydrogenase family)